MSKSLVTGGCGFIGSHLVDRLVDMGHKVVVIDNESAKSNDKFYKNDKAEYHKLNITHFNKIEPLFKGVDYVFHLAAESRIEPTMKNPQKACSVNMVGTANVLQASRNHKVKRFVYSSTSAAYGEKNTPPFSERMTNDCLNPYSVSKVAGEDLVKMYYKLWGLKATVLRYFSVYGERQPKKGLYAPVVGLFLRQKSEGQPLTVTGDGSQRRDFVYVQDVVDANIRAAGLESGLENSIIICGETYNIGSGKDYSILEIAEMINEKNIKFIAPRKGEPFRNLADIFQARSELGYEPKTDIKTWINQQLQNT